MKKIKIGILFGVVAGIIDVIPMIMQKLTWWLFRSDHASRFGQTVPL